MKKPWCAGMSIVFETLVCSLWGQVLVGERSIDRDLDIPADAVCEIGSQEGGGNVLLRGVTIRYKGLRHSAPAFLIRSNGTLRGWGKATSSDDIENQLMVKMDGLVVADGEGMNRDLDFGHAIGVASTPSTHVHATRGWYAVRCGRVVFPRCWIKVVAGACSEWSLGDVSKPEMLRTVNAVAGRIWTQNSEWEKGCVVKGAFCSCDRHDLPTGLPSADRVVGVWALWTQRGIQQNERVSFAMTDIRFIYDPGCVKDEANLKMLRWKDGAWSCEARLKASTVRSVVDLSNQKPLDNDEFNIGLYALVVGQ